MKVMKKRVTLITLAVVIIIIFAAFFFIYLGDKNNPEQPNEPSDSRGVPTGN